MSTKQYTGCTDANMVGEYILYNGVSANPLWDSNQNAEAFPTTAQLAAFQAVSSCDENRPDNVIGSPIRGTDGASFSLGGADLNGFAKKNHRVNSRCVRGTGQAEIDAGFGYHFTTKIAWYFC